MFTYFISFINMLFVCICYQWTISKNVWTTNCSWWKHRTEWWENLNKIRTGYQNNGMCVFLQYWNAMYSFSKSRFCAYIMIFVRLLISLNGNSLSKSCVASYNALFILKQKWGCKTIINNSNTKIVIVFKLIEHIFKYYIVGWLWIRLATSSFLIDNPLNKLLLWKLKPWLTNYI